MSTSIHANYSGTFSTGATLTPVALSLPASATEIEVVNLTGMAGASAELIKAEGFSGAAADSAITYTGGGGVAAINAAGFTFFSDSGLDVTGSAITTAAGITNAAPPVVTSGTLPPVGSVVRLFNTTTALQLSGMDYTVTVSGAGTFTLGYVATAPGSAATANTYRVLPFQYTPVSAAIGTPSPLSPNPRFYPRTRYITGITAAANPVVSLSVAHQFKVGEKVRVIVPSGWGMTQINGALATIVAVSYGTVANNSNTITLDVSTVGMTAFAYPTSAQAALGISFPMIVPVGEAAVNTIALPVANNLDDSTKNVSIAGVVVGTGCMLASRDYQWIAKKGQAI